MEIAMQRQDSFEHDLLQLQPDLNRFARGLAGDPAAAEDLVQETLARALQHRGKFTPHSNLRAWTFTILRNFHHSQWHKEKRSVPWEEWFEKGTESLPEQEAGLMLDELFGQVCALSECQRQALLLIGVEGCSYDEAAAMAKCPVGTMKSRVSRARESLQAALRKRLSGTRPLRFSSAAAVLDMARRITGAVPHPG